MKENPKRLKLAQPIFAEFYDAIFYKYEKIIFQSLYKNILYCYLPPVEKKTYSSILQKQLQRRHSANRNYYSRH